MRKRSLLSVAILISSGISFAGGCTSQRVGPPNTSSTTMGSGGAAGDGGPSGDTGGGAMAAATGGTAAVAGLYYQTKTPYSPQQSAATYEAAPSGFSLVYTELVARHGTRGLSGMKDDLAIYNLWQKASAAGALTPLAANLGPDVVKIMRANFLLGYGVPGISKPGYGNETQLGIVEHKLLATRLLTRDAELFAQVGASAISGARQIVVVTSGVDRAVDSGAFFVGTLLATQPNLTPLVSYPPAPGPFPASSPVGQPAGTNRFLLYFHKLAPATDLVTDVNDPLYATYQDSRAYQAFQSDVDMTAKQSAILTDPAAAAAGRAVLERLFSKDFVDQLENRTFSVDNSGTFTYSSDDGKFTSTLTGDGKTTLTSAAEAAVSLYALYAVAPALKAEADVDFTPYLAPEQARYLAYTQDASDFYAKGPGITEKGDINWRMAQILEDDFFDEVDAIARGELSHAAKLRFTHAEIMIPFAAALGLRGASEQTPLATMYTYDDNPWRGELVSPMAANVQWDVVRDASGRLLVKMLYNEKEIDFRASCDAARAANGSHYYDYPKLKACNGHVTPP
jgi:hypothetical protein